MRGAPMRTTYQDEFSTPPGPVQRPLYPKRSTPEQEGSVAEAISSWDEPTRSASQSPNLSWERRNSRPELDRHSSPVRTSGVLSRHSHIPVDLSNISSDPHPVYGTPLSNLRGSTRSPSSTQQFEARSRGPPDLTDDTNYNDFDRRPPVSSNPTAILADKLVEQAYAAGAEMAAQEHRHSRLEGELRLETALLEQALFDREAARVAEKQAQRRARAALVERDASAAAAAAADARARRKGKAGAVSSDGPVSQTQALIARDRALARLERRVEDMEGMATSTSRTPDGTRAPPTVSPVRNDPACVRSPVPFELDRDEPGLPVAVTRTDHSVLVEGSVGRTLSPTGTTTETTAFLPDHDLPDDPSANANAFIAGASDVRTPEDVVGASPRRKTNSTPVAHGVLVEIHRGATLRPSQGNNDLQEATKTGATERIANVTTSLAGQPNDNDSAVEGNSLVSENTSYSADDSGDTSANVVAVIGLGGQQQPASTTSRVNLPSDRVTLRNATVTHEHGGSRTQQSRLSSDNQRESYRAPSSSRLYDVNMRRTMRIPGLEGSDDDFVADKRGRLAWPLPWGGDR